MATVLLYICLAGVALATLAQPWIGVVAAYVFAVLGPQFIWWWAFEGVRPALWVLVPTFIGIIALMFRGKLNFDGLKTKQNLFFFILWLCFIASSFVGPYVDVKSPYRWFEVEWALALVNNIFLSYFAAVLLIDTEKKLKCMALVMVIATVYLSYWINKDYLSGQYMFHATSGRIGGPTDLSGSGLYAEENAFAILFVTGLPFLYYFGLYSKRKIIRYGLWSVLPFGWHAVFLTGSRGGLLGLGITLLVMAFRSSRKIVGFGLILLFVLAYQWQAGSTMKGRAETIADYEQETSAETRIEAWKAAIGMIKAYPLTGVGLASFGVAFPDYSSKKPRDAHNTFFLIAAESGLVAGIMYLLLIFTTVLGLWKRASTLRRQKAIYDGNFIYCLNDALLTSFTGLLICSIFISLAVYEIIYFLFALASILSFLSKQEASGPVLNHDYKPYYSQYSS